MIRQATIPDLPALYDLVLEMYRATDYPARGLSVSEPAAKGLLRDAVVRNGRTNDGGTLFNVIEVDGQLVGFMIGALQRVYMIGNRLEAQDIYLFCSPAAPVRAPERLIDAYIEWAASNAKVAEITLSFTNVGGVKVAKLARLYKRKGFSQIGQIWKRGGL